MFNSTVGNSSLCWSMTLHTFEVPVPTAQFVIFLGLLGFSNIQFLPKRISASISHPTSKVGIDWTIWKFLPSILISAIFFIYVQSSYRHRFRRLRELIIGTILSRDRSGAAYRRNLLLSVPKEYCFVW